MNYDSIPEIADDLNRLRGEIEDLSARIEHGGVDSDHVRSKLGDYVTVLFGLHERLIEFNRPTHELPAVGVERDGIRGTLHDSLTAGGE